MWRIGGYGSTVPVRGQQLEQISRALKVLVMGGRYLWYLMLCWWCVEGPSRLPYQSVMNEVTMLSRKQTVSNCGRGEGRGGLVWSWTFQAARGGNSLWLTHFDSVTGVIVLRKGTDTKQIQLAAFNATGRKFVQPSSRGFLKGLLSRLFLWRLSRNQSFQGAVHTQKRQSCGPAAVCFGR